MAKASPSYRKILSKAMPALLVLFLIFISLMIVIKYTGSFYLVLLLWIVVPVFMVQAYRRIRNWFSRD